MIEYPEWRGSNHSVRWWCKPRCRCCLCIGFVYLVSGAGLVKIGTSEQPHKRVCNIQTSSPVLIEAVAMFHGGRRVERALHRAFAGSRERGEWFNLRADVGLFMLGLPPGGAAPSSVRAWLRSVIDQPPGISAAANYKQCLWMEKNHAL